MRLEWLEHADALLDPPEVQLGSVDCAIEAAPEAERLAEMDDWNAEVSCPERKQRPHGWIPAGSAEPVREREVVRQLNGARRRRLTPHTHADLRRILVIGPSEYGARYRILTAARPAHSTRRRTDAWRQFSLDRDMIRPRVQDSSIGLVLELDVGRYRRSSEWLVPSDADGGCL